MRRNVAGQAIRFSLFKNGARIDNPTIVAGDAKVDLDGAGQVNVNAVPTSDAAGLVTWSPTQAETNADVVSLLLVDAAGGEWDPVTQVFYTEMETTVATNLDAAISTRATQADILSDATPFAGANVDAAISSRATQADILSDATPFAGANLDAAISTRATAATAAAAVWAAVAEGVLTYAEFQTIMFSVLAGRSTGGGTANIDFRDLADTKSRVTVTVDANGNRTAIVALDGA